MRHLAFLLVAVHFVGGLAHAQEDPRDKELKALRGTVQQLEQTLQEVRAKLAELERQSATTNVAVTNVAEGKPVLPAPASGSNYLVIAEQRIDLPATPEALRSFGVSRIPDYDNFTDQQPGAPRPDNETIDPEMKGFIPLPGTKTILRFGGTARLDGIYDSADNGNPNLFTPSSIPVPGQAGADGGPRSQIEAKGTRISFEARRPVGESGSLRIYNENDFFNNSTASSMDFRVRHFYGKAWNVLVGQTFSAFMNVDAWPDVLDYQGPNAMVNRRQAQLRYTPVLWDDTTQMYLLFSLEQPESQINTTATGIPAGAEAVSRAPDGVVGWRWEGGVGHVQVSGLFRSLGYDADNAPDDTVFGWGVSASGAFNGYQKDRFFWQLTYGEGIARYVNDLGGNNLDAAPDASGNLEAIPVFAAMTGYTHHWSKHFRSSVSYGYVKVDPTASLGGFAVEDTQYASVNLVWHPTTSFRMGLEYLYGFKTTLSDAERDGHRLNFVVRYDLVR